MGDACYSYGANSSGIAKKIIDNMPLFIAGYHDQVTLSIGISLYPQDANDLDTIMKLADKAMYTAKKRGKNNYQLFGNST